MHLHSHSHELSLGLSFFLGALHALEPGHGKTAMFVYLLDGKRSFWHPVVMGLSTAFSHSVSLFAIAFGVHIAHHLIAGDHHHEEQVSSVLQWISALLVVAVGGFLLVQAIRGRKVKCCGHHHHDGDCSNHSHSHAGNHSHSHASCSIEPQLVQLGGVVSGKSSAGNNNTVAAAVMPMTSTVVESNESTRSRSSYRTTAILGLAVGLLPCPTTMAAYFTGLSSGSPGATYLIIGLFAAGIASSLSVVGILLQYFGEKFGRRSERLVNLPWNYIRSALILGIGLIYLVRLITDSAA
ncbi:MAG: sulfite exporter TauE/SafE family protein [Planctomycetaceae bacterium]